MYENDIVPNAAPRKLGEAAPADAAAAGVFAKAEAEVCGQDGSRPIEFESRPGGCDIVPPTPAPIRLPEGEVEPCAESRSGGADLYMEKVGVNGEKESMPTSGVLHFIGCAAVVLAALWLFTVSSPFLANALTQSGWRMWTSMAMALLPPTSILSLIAYVWRRMKRIPAVEQFCERDYTNKAKLRRDLTERYLGLMTDIIQYAKSNGFGTEGRDMREARVVECLQRLKGDAAGRYSDTGGWFSEFKAFQSIQDERADEIIGKAWKLVATKTAASPWKTVDMIAVAYNSTIMVSRLARLYNRRVSCSAAFRLVIRWFANIYIAGRTGDITQDAVEWANANNLVSATYKPLAGLFGKVAEGGANAFLVYRLGCRAKAYFRPLI